MFARTNLGTGDPARAEESIRFTREVVRPTVEAQPGYRGMALAVDRELGKSLVTTYWDTEEAMQGSESGVVGVRKEATTLMNGTVTVRHAEVVESHTVRKPPRGAWLRVTSIEVDPDEVDQAIESWHASTLPAIEAQPGNCQALLYLDRRTGRGASTSVWESRDALVTSRSPSATIRAEGTAKAHATVQNVEEYELVFSSLNRG